MKNNTGGGINSITVPWTGEEWRKENNASAHTLQLYYQTGTTVTDLVAGSWTAAPSIFTSPIIGATVATALDGNAPANRTSGISVTITVFVAAGDEIMLRWEDLNDAGNDHQMAIDDVTVNATAAPANTITTGLVSTPPFVLANCAATASGTVAFTSTDVFAGTNNFIAQLSDDIGSFAAPITIGTLPLTGGTAPSGTINITIPAGTPSGTGYRIRVVSDNPAVTGSLSSAFTITQNGLGGCSSSHSDYYRSFQTGDWDDITTWESSPNNIDWVPATLAPTSLANTITINNTHIVTVFVSTSADQVVILNGATLIHSTGTFTIEDGTGDDVNINSGGAFVLAFASTPPVFGAGSPTVNINTGGILRVSATGLTGAGTGVNLNNFVYQHQSILEYTLTSQFSSSNVVYFPNANAATIPIFRTTAVGGVANVGSANPTVFNGIFECNGGAVTWQGAGTKTFRNGVRGTGDITALVGSGTFIINGTTAELGGTGILTAPTTGVQIGATTTASVTSNKTITGDVTLLADSYIDLGGNNLTVSGTITGGAANAYVKTSSTSGVLRMNAVTARTFPVGNSSYNPIDISNGQGVDYYVKVEDGINPAVAFPTYGINRTWSIYASALTPNVGVVFQYATADANAGATPQPQPMEILSNTGSVWNIVPGNTNINPGGADPAWTITTATALTITGSLTPYALGIDGGWILPLDCIISCRSRKVNNSGIISWDINSCSEVNSFEVQRSVNGGAYQTIGTITPGTSLEYSYTDASLAKGTNLYRIKVNRSSGAVKYSNTVAVINDTKGILITALSPNPVADKATLVINAAKPGAVNFAIYDITGRPVRQWSATIAEGSNTVTVNAATLPGGIYHLAAMTGDSKTVIRFMKQ